MNKLFASHKWSTDLNRSWVKVYGVLWGINQCIDLIVFLHETTDNNYGINEKQEKNCS